MKFTLSWLKQFLDTESTVEEIAVNLTDIGLEVEEIIDRRGELKDFQVAKILSTKPHPNADKLRVCSVESVQGNLQIVCGAPNAREGIYVVLAPVGSVIPNGNFKIKESEIRGVKSSGMLCSEPELMIGTDSDGIIELSDYAKIGDQFAKYYGLDDPVFHINITPNRGDALGVYGIARDLAARGLGKLKPLEVSEVTHQFNTEFNLAVKDHSACPLFGLREIQGINNTESPDWLKKLLHTIGVGSISAVVDVTNYISYSFGHPMHAYDADKVNGELTVEVLKHGVRFQALNKKEYELELGDLIIRDSSKTHCLAGIIGGEESSCRANTQNIILEAACFNADFIAKTARRLQIDTDSKYRYERGVDQAFTQKALDIATKMILSICGGQVSNALVKGETTVNTKVIAFPKNYLTAVTGIILNIDKIVEILEKLGFKTSVVDNDCVQVQVPSWRHDIELKEDIVEEITRIYGYDKIPTIPLPNARITRIIDSKQRRVHDIRRLVASYGYNEVVTWSFMERDTAKLFADVKEELTIINPISRDLNYMRPTLVPNLLKIIAKNQVRSFRDMGFFEIGPVFWGANPEDEHRAIAAVKCGYNNILKNWHITQRYVDVFDIKSDIAGILSFVSFSIEKCQIVECALQYYHPTRSASLRLGKNIIGHFGQIHPLILKHFEIEQDVVGFELNIDNIPLSKQKFGKKEEYKVSDFQSVVRDYAFIVGADAPVGEILSYVKDIDKKLIKSVQLFDVYQGNNIEASKKSIAISFTLQADDRTLTEEDLTRLDHLIITNVVQKFKAVLRGT